MSTLDVSGGIETYNYESFSRSESAGKSHEFKNVLRAGEKAPDFELPTLQGDRVRLSTFRGSKHVLLEFGSITCPPFVGEVSPLNELYRRYRDQGFEFFTVYVREPHPGEHYGRTGAGSKKLNCAGLSRAGRDSNAHLVDDLEGTVHR